MAYERTWAFSFDNLYSPTTTTADQTNRQLWDLKAMLCGQYGGFTQGLWTVYSSCDGVTAGNADGPGVDRWGSTYDTTKFVHAGAGVAHSWIVLKSPTMGGYVFYMLIAPDSATTTTASIALAKTPFAGGTTTANPTSADSWLVSGIASAWNGATVAPLIHRSNMCLSSTGDFYYFTVQAGIGWATFAAAVVVPVGCHALDAYPLWAYRNYTVSQPGCFDKGQLASGTTSQPTRLAYGQAGYVGIVSMGTAQGPTAALDLLTGKQYALTPWVMASVSATTIWHARGRLPDTYILPGHSSTPVPASG